MDWAEISQQEAAERIGVTQVFVSQLVRGDRNPSLRTAHKILQAMQAPKEGGEVYEDIIQPVEWLGESDAA